MVTAATSRCGSAGRRALALAAVLASVATVGLVHTGTAAAASCSIGCPAMFGFTPRNSGDIADTTATLSFFAIGSSSVGNTYSWHFAWGLSGGSLDQTTLGSDTIDPGTFASHGTTITGLQPNTTYDVQAVATNTLGDEVDGPVLTFTTTDPCAAGHCLSLSGAHTPNTFATGADVTVTVHTGGYPTQWHVEWQSGSETGYPNHSSPEQSVPGNAPDQAYTVHIGGLTPSTAYTARIVATNTAVPVQTAEVDFTFSTLDSCSAGGCPSILSAAAQVVSDTSERIVGNIATFGTPTQWALEYSTDTSYSLSLPVQTLPGSSAPDVVDVTLTGLAPLTLYHYRFVAVNSAGTVAEPDQTFTTDNPCNWNHCPTITSPGTAAVGPHAATVFATVATGGLDTTWAIDVWTGTGAPQTAATAVMPGAQGSGEVSAQLSSLLGNTPYNFRISATSATGSVYVTGSFTTADPCGAGVCADPRQPTVILVTDTTAHVIGFVGTRNQPTTWTLQLSSDGGTTWTTADTGALAASSIEASELDVDLSGLTPQTNYLVRIVADNGEGPVTGSPAAFFTGDACAFGRCPAASIATTLVRATRAVLGGAIDTKGSDTSWTINWGISTAYTGGTITGDPLLGATGGTSPVDPVTISGLQPSTTYHFQVVATNGWGTTTGIDQTFTTSAAFVDTDSIAWQSGPGLPKAWSGFTAADLNGTMFVTGNDLSGSLYTFDPYHGQDEFALQSAHAPYATQEEGSAYLGTDLWLMSVGLPVGSPSQPPQRVAEIYHSATGTWSTGPVVVNEDTLSLIHPAFVNAGGTLYAFGGRGVPGPGRSHIYDEAWKLSADQTQWLPITAPPTPVADPGVASGADGRVYLFGGVACVRGGFDGHPYFADCLQGSVTNITQIYDPATDTWSQGAPMPTARYSLTAIHAGCALYAIGGLSRRPLEPNSTGNPTDQIVYGASVSTVEVYNPVDDRWIPAPALHEARADFAAAFVGHQIWVLGGGPEPESATTEYLTPAVVASSTVSPAQPDGLHGWYMTRPNVTVDACNGIGGPASLIYGFDGTTTGHAYTGSAQTTSVPEGQHDFTYGAFDAEHNAATNVTRHFKVDLTPPAISFSGIVANAYSFSVTDAGSGVDHVVFAAMTPSGTVGLGTQTSGFSIALASLPAGTTSVTATAYDIAGNHASFIQTAGLPTQLSLLSPTSGTYGHVVILAARLRDLSHTPATLLSGRHVTLSVGSQSCTATTVLGLAVCSVRLAQAPGTLPLTATFAGAAQYLPAQDTGSFTLRKAPTVVKLTSDLVSASSPRLSATLVDDAGHPLAGRTIVFTVGSTNATAVTNASGVATTGVLSLTPGRYLVRAAFAGDTYYGADADGPDAVIVYRPTKFVVWGDPDWRHLYAGRSCTFWGSQWSRQVSRGDSFPGASAFTGYADSDNGDHWSAKPGNASAPPATVDAYIGVIVTTHASKSGSTLNGDTDGYVVIKVDNPGSYRPNPGHDGTGVVVGIAP